MAGRKKKRRTRIKKPIVDGRKFDSGLEADHYKILKEHPDIEIIDLQKTFLLQESTKYIGFPKKNKRSFDTITYTPDFIIKAKGFDKPIAMESKGYARPVYQMRKKLFVNKYQDEYYFYECRSVKQLKEDLERVSDS